MLFDGWFIARATAVKAHPPDMRGVGTASKAISDTAGCFTLRQ